MISRSTVDVERLLRETPFVRALARDLAAGDGDDLVQQTFLQALAAGRAPIRDVRSWLARIARRAASNARREGARRAARERTAAARERVPSSAELAEREEQRRALVAAVDSLPPPMRDVVVLRYFEGLPPRRIAAELGLPVSHVWNRLRDALLRLRARLDAAHGGDRKAWLMALSPLTRRGPAPRPVSPLPTFGLLAMATHTKTLLLTGGCAAAAAGLLWIATSTPPTGDPGRQPAAPPPASAMTGTQRPVTDAPAEPTRRAAIATAAQEPAPMTGDLRVVLQYADGTPADDVLVLITHRGLVDRAYGELRARTDGAGIATFTELPGGAGVAEFTREPEMHRFEITPGETSDLEVTLEGGLTVKGVVVDADGVGIGGAEVYTAPLARSDRGIERATTTDAAGRFSIRAVPHAFHIAARAAGYAATPLRYSSGSRGGVLEVRLVMDQRGGTVRGIVRSPTGAPVAGAIVWLGDGEFRGLAGSRESKPWPAEVRTDSEGEFQVVGVAAGEQRVAVRAEGFAVWRGTVHAVELADVSVDVSLDLAPRCAGTVTDADGNPLRRVEVEAGEWGQPEHLRTFTDRDGRFTLEGGSAGAVEVRAAHDDHGKAAATLQLVHGETVEWSPVLSRGVVLRGRVTAGGEPVASAIVEARPSDPGTRWWGHAYTEPDGSFEVANCPENGTLEITIRSRHLETVQRSAVDPRAGPLVVAGQRLVADAGIRGVVLRPDGTPAANVRVSPSKRGATGGRVDTTDADTGAFSMERLQPGTYRLVVRSDDYPTLRTPWRALASEETWDVGVLQLVEGGTVRVPLDAPLPEKAYVSLFDDGAFIASMRERDGALVSDLAPPGRYRMALTGTGAAAASVPVEVVAGRETTAALSIAAGIPHTLQAALPSEGMHDVRFRVVADGRPVVARIHNTRGRASAQLDCALAPGSYTVLVEAGGLRAERTLHVDAAAPPQTVRLELR